MEGISTISYRGKEIYIVDFEGYGKSKDETVRLINAISDELVKNPLNSVLALIDVSNAFFHFETFKNFKEMQEKAGPYTKKIAVVGLKGLQKAGFNTIAGPNAKGPVKAFDTPDEAKEWLYTD